MNAHAGRQSATPSKAKKGTNPLRLFLEAVFFIGWLFCTGVLGYFVGHTRKISAAQADCPPVPGAATAQTQAAAKPPCIKRTVTAAAADTHAAVDGENARTLDAGYTLAELERQWTCSHASATDASQVNVPLKPAVPGDLDKTKWKSVLSVEPKAFFDKYLQQYPGDTRAVQPVVVFSHKPLNSVEEIDSVCKVRAFLVFLFVFDAVSSNV